MGINDQLINKNIYAQMFHQIALQTNELHQVTVVKGSFTSQRIVTLSRPEDSQKQIQDLLF